MDVPSTTRDPSVVQESVGDVALKTWTLYFLVTALILGVLFFAAVRKASRICCWNCMYGSKYIRDQKEDPRVPSTMFRTPSILATLQDRYDKNKSSIRSKPGSQSYSRSVDTIEMGSVQSESGTASKHTFSALMAETDENARVHKYLDSLEDTAKDDQAAEYDVIPTDTDEQASTSQQDRRDLSVPTDNGMSTGFDGSDAGTSQQSRGLDMDTVTDAGSDYNTIGGASTDSQASLASTMTNDRYPLVSLDPSGDNSSRQGRYKKYRGPSVTPAGTGVSTRSASAMSSKRVNKNLEK